MTNKFSKVVERIKAKSIPVVAGASAVAMLSVPSFATTAEPLPTLAITQDMLSPLVEGVISNVGTILPVGLGLFAVFIGIKLIPRIISRFTGV